MLISRRLFRALASRGAGDFGNHPAFYLSLRELPSPQLGHAA